MARRKKLHLKPANLKWWFFPILSALLILIPKVYSSSDLGWLMNSKFKPVVYTTSPLPVPISDFTKPPINSNHIFIMDRTSKTILWDRGSKNRVYPASTTKMMTALVAMEAFELDTTITVTRSYFEGQVVGFKPFDKLTVDQLLYALLIQSGNDAAEILAENFPGGRVAFVEAMNKKALELGLTNTHFTNPSGLDEYGHYSTALDLAHLADVAMNKSEFAKIVALENAVITTEDNQNYIVKNVNQLLGKVPGVLGVKTGYTVGAGQSLVTLVNRDGHEVIISLLGSLDRFSDTQKIIDWVYGNFTWVDSSQYIQELQPELEP
ncbi:MAG: D-alanyl-D-alanine carboxypeptidase family protein [Candidatus Amesbacteria bacterium]|nr:D-alanyl-D-alanine carboxypeptidase family protein [Candidatus Amesbacteria bacterium]